MQGGSPERRPSVARPSPLDLPAFVPYACAQLQAPFSVRVVIEAQEEYVSKAGDDKSKKAGKSKSLHAQPSSRTRTESQERSPGESPAQAAGGDRAEAVLTVVVDGGGRPLELALGDGPVPRLLLQVLALTVPHQPLLARLSVRARAPLPGAVLHEICKLPPLSQLTDVLLDDSPVPERNYGPLLECGRLRALSLARCQLDDEDCGALAAHLTHPEPASLRLRTLSLAGNLLTDAGAAALATALRSNRTLHHLDLSGNRIADEGARALLRPLVEFPLLYEELTAKRRRLVEFLRMRREVHRRCMEELAAAWAERMDDGARGAGGKRRTLASSARVRNSSATSSAVQAPQEALSARADAMVNELVGAHGDPFGLEETLARDGYVHSLGNTSLCYLNLAGNHVGYLALAALLAVLRYQAALVRKAGPGLLRVVLDGNPLPVACPEYASIRDLLDTAVQWKLSKPLNKKVEKPKSKK